MEEADKSKPEDQKKADTNQTGQEAFQYPSTTAKYITAVPVDLTQIESFSKYRSCAGHERAGTSFEQTVETDRSMKHYLYPVSAYQGTIDKVKMFAPFDGTVATLDLETNKVGGRPKGGNGITFTTPVDPNVLFGFGHIYFVKDFKVGDSVKAGELIGYAALGEKGNDFDIDLEGLEHYNGTIQMRADVLGSAFDHMTDSVLAEFAKHGITPENTKFTKEYRDAHPCNYVGPSKDNNQSSLGVRPGEGWIELTK